MTIGGAGLLWPLCSGPRGDPGSFHLFALLTIPMIVPFSECIKIVDWLDHDPKNRMEERRKAQSENGTHHF